MGTCSHLHHKPGYVRIASSISGLDGAEVELDMLKEWID